MKLLGMIGGTSWHSTIEYYRLINEMVCEVAGLHKNPPLLLYSLTVEIMKEGDWEKISAKYLEIALSLESEGAQGIIICANTPHKVFDFVQPQIGIPILHITDAVAAEATNRKYKSLGLLGTRPVLKGSFVKDRLKSSGITVFIPGEKDIEISHNYISEELTQGKFTEEAQGFFLQQIKNLKEEGADAIILGCTELPILLKGKEVDIPLLDTTSLHAKMAADFILKDSY